MKNLKASILVVNYNNGKYIKQNIESLKNQVYKNIEIIYHDDLSTDNSIEILKKFKNIKLIKNKKKGKFGSFNQMDGFIRAFKKSTGDVIFLLDSDDYFDFKKVKTIISKFQNNQKITAIYDLPILVKKNNFINVKNKKNFLKTYWPYIPPQSCITIKKQKFNKIMKKISFRLFPDIWMDFRMAIYLKYVEKNFFILEKNLTYYRIVENSASSKFKFLSINWWKRRMQAHKYIIFFFKKNYLIHSKNSDYHITKFINFFLK
mgnify:CR=1 FL=1